MGKNTPIYLDYQATTPADARVVEAMLPYFSEIFGNPHSSAHAYGWQAEAAVDLAREQVAALIGSSAKEIIFTSGATESNNLTILGIARYYASTPKRHIITAVTEHKCVIEACRQAEAEGYRVTFLPVGRDGLIDIDQLARAIDETTLLVSIMAVNNEIGVIQNLKAIGDICKAREVYFHSDAAQAFGKIPLDVNELHLSAMSISSHKCYGPKGIGALYLRRKPKTKLLPLFYGGGQERGVRPGTLPTPLIVGLGKAAEIAKAEMKEEAARIGALQQRMWKQLQDALPDCVLNGHATERWPGNLNISFPSANPNTLMKQLRGVAVSSGSACASATAEPSYVLQSLGLEKKLQGVALRIGIGRPTTEAEIDEAAKHIIDAVRSK